MPDISLQLVLFLLCVGLFTGAAAVWDLRTRRIPNKLTLPVFGFGLLYQVVFSGLAGLSDAGLAFLLGFGVLFVLWLIGGGGGGDVKLIGALSVWLGFRLTLMVLISSTLFVIVGTFSVMVWGVITHGPRRFKKKFLATGKDQNRKNQKKETIEQRRKRRVMAYALPVALATWVVVIYKLPTFPFLGN